VRDEAHHSRVGGHVETARVGSGECGHDCDRFCGQPVKRGLDQSHGPTITMLSGQSLRGYSSAAGTGY